MKEEAWNNFTGDGWLILSLYPSLWKDNQVSPIGLLRTKQDRECTQLLKFI